jgi:hypothetical protein
LATYRGDVDPGVGQHIYDAVLIRQSLQCGQRGPSQVGSVDAQVQLNAQGKTGKGGGGVKYERKAKYEAESV